MILPQFTVGPWRRGEGPLRRRIYSPDGLVVCEVWSRDRALRNAETNATANLIVAAPDMFKALARLIAADDARANWPDDDSTKRFDAMLYELEDARSEAEAALAKALGE
jgi:hypothetical protein